MHQGSVGTEKWTARGSPHIVPYDLSINGVLTLEPCAEVLIADGKTITVGAGGQLIAVGFPDQPVHIGARDPRLPFAQLRAINGGTLHLAYVAIDGGGDPLGTPADVTGTIVATGADQMAATQSTVLVDHVTITGSKSNGLYLAEGAGFASGSTRGTKSTRSFCRGSVGRPRCRKTR
jgi:hypothetical protein